MNPGIARLAIVIALVIGGVAVLANGFDDQGVAATPEPSTSQSPTGSPTPSRSPQASIVPNQKGVLVQVLNGTSTAGYAADFQEMLVDVGEYLPAGDAGDAPDKPIVDSIVYFRADDNKAQNEADAQLLSDEYLGSVPVQRLPADLADSGVIDDAADVVVVLGEDQAGEL
ncbi:MAG: LytR C-terminal domain-containing protein [Actinomycetota bacterium]